VVVVEAEKIPLSSFLYCLQLCFRLLPGAWSRLLVHSVVQVLRYLRACVLRWLASNTALDAARLLLLLLKEVETL
jgi:hypothetical protein